MATARAKRPRYVVTEKFVTGGIVLNLSDRESHFLLLQLSQINLNSVAMDIYRTLRTALNTPEEE